MLLTKVILLFETGCYSQCCCVVICMSSTNPHKQNNSSKQRRHITLRLLELVKWWRTHMVSRWWHTCWLVINASHWYPFDHGTSAEAQDSYPHHM